MPQPRMRFAPGDEGAEPVISALLDRYEHWARARHPQVEVVDASDLDLLLQWKINYADGRLDEWTVDQVEEFLLGWCPRKLMVSATQAASIPGNVADAFAFLANERLLSPRSTPGARLAAHARTLARRFTAEMANPANVGLGKSIFGSLGMDPSEAVTPERLAALTEQFNALPFEERTAITDPAFGDDDAALPVIGPVRLPDDDAVRASADSSPVLRAFTAMAEYFRAPGRPLTARGNIKLADAESLSGLLGTETLEERIGTHTFRRHSAAEMPGLDHWQWWAREVGALRLRNGRMIGVEAWLRRRAKDPVGEARKAFGVLTAFGPIGSYTPGVPRNVDRLTDQLLAPLLGLLLSAGRPVEFDRLVDVLESARDMTGDQGFFAEHPEYRRTESGQAMDRLLHVLEHAGVVTQRGARQEKVHRIEQRVGGTAQLTPFGVDTAVAYVRASGPDVVTLGEPATMTARDVAELAIAQEIDPRAWVEVLDAWAEHQEDRPGSLLAVIEAMAGDDALLIGLGLPMPIALEEDIARAMERLTKTRAPDDILGAVALIWLANHDRLDGADLPRAAVLTTAVATLGLIAQDEPQAVPEAMGTGEHERPGNLDLIAHAARATVPHVEALLDAIALFHPDKVVTRAARKELIRVRSRVASRGPVTR